MDIPKDFDSKWELSDVILIADDADGNKKELHANKAYLSTFSSVFKSMFFSSFKEPNSESVKVSCDYESLKLILQVIYGLSKNVYIINEPLEVGVLTKLYKMADYLDVPVIRKMCIRQMKRKQSVEMAVAVLGITTFGDCHHSILMTILEKLSPGDIKKFLSTEDSQPLFSKMDVKRIYKWIAKKDLPKEEDDTYSSWICDKPVPDLYEKFKNGGVDCTQKFPRSDVLFKTKNSEGKELHSNKAVLAMVSSHFDNLFFGSSDTETTNLAEIEVDVDYMVMKNILTIVHHSFDICNFSITPYLIYKLYLAASKENLDIPMIRSFCVRELMDRADEYDCEMATFMKLEVDERLSVVKNMEFGDIRDWLAHSSDTASSKYFCSLNEEEYWIQFTSEKKPIVSTTEVSIMIEKLLEEHDKSD